MAVILTERARERALRFLSSEPRALGLRFGVKKVGCSGWQYQIDVAREQRSDDQVFEQDGVRVLVDAQSLPIVDGTEIDFERQGLNAQFVFRNPNVTALCGCGESFSVEREASF